MASQLGIGPIEGLGLPAGLGSIFSILGSFSSFGDWLRLFLIGGLLETGRRSLWSLWYYLLQYLYLEAIIESHEPAYRTFDWRKTELR
jgi:chaperone BCS1